MSPVVLVEVHGRIRIVSLVRTWMSLSGRTAPVDRMTWAVQPGFSGRTSAVTSRRMANPSKTIDVILTMRQLVSGRHFGTGSSGRRGSAVQSGFNVLKSAIAFRRIANRSTMIDVASCAGRSPRSSSLHFTGSRLDVTFGPGSSGRRGSAVRPGFNGRTFTVTSRRTANPSTVIDVAFRFRPSSTVKFVSSHRLASGCHFRAGQLQSIE